MSACSFNRLLRLVNRELDLDGQLEVYRHLDRCDICRDTVCQLSRDRDEAFFTGCARAVKPLVPHNVVDAEVRSPGR